MTERLTRKRGPGLPPLPDWLRFPVPSAAGVLCAGRIAVLIADDDGPDALGLSLAARLVCAHPRVRRRFRGRTWWLPIGERPPGRTATRAALQHRDDLLGGRPLGFTGDWWSEQSQAILAGYRRLLLVVDDVAPGAFEPEQLLSREPGHAGLLVSGSGRVPPGLTPIAVPAVALGQRARAALRERWDDSFTALAVFDLGAAVPMDLIDDPGPPVRAGLLRYGPGSTVTIDPVVTARGRELLGPAGLREAAAALLNRARLPAELLVPLLLRAGRRERAATLTADLRWIAGRVVDDGPAAALADLAATEDFDDDARARTASFLAAAGLLDPIEPAGALGDLLIDELRHDPAWRRPPEAAHPVLRSDAPRLPRRPGVGQAVLGPDRRHLAYDVDHRVTCVELASGTTTTLELGRGEMVARLRFDPAGRWLAVLSHDARNGSGVEDPPYSTYLRVWEHGTGWNRFTLSESRHRRHFTSFEIGADGESLFLRAENGEYGVDPLTGAVGAGARPPTDPGADPLTSPNGSWRAEIEDNVLRLHDLRNDRPGPVTRTSERRYDGIAGVLWIADDHLVAYGRAGLQHFRIIAAAGRDND